ncbi:MAG: aspartate aminotransferase family protein [Promethearchaeota archaeon]
MTEFSDEYIKKTSRSKDLFERAMKVMPGGVCHNIRYFPPYPIFIDGNKGAKGSRIYDVDGNEYIDFWMGHYALIFGHAPEAIINALKEQLEYGTHWGIVNDLQVELAELVHSIVSCAEMVRFGVSGTEATMYAVRLARAFTKRKTILKVDGGWHGGNTDLSVAIHSPYDMPESAGLLQEATKYTKSLPFNDIDLASQILRENKGDLAAVIIEPVVGAGGAIPAEKEYLKTLRDLTEEFGGVLIFDEVITGFRLALGGAQEFYGITPDLATLGKILGGGMPIGAVVGREDILALASPLKERKKWESVLMGGGTFSINPLSMRAGIITLSLLQRDELKIYPKLNAMGLKAKQGIEKALVEQGAKCTGVGSFFQVHFPFEQEVTLRSPRDIETLTDVKKRDHEFKLRLINKGFFVMHGGGAVSTAHSESEIKHLIESVDEIGSEMN